MQYLVEKYDTEHKISVSGFEEKMQQLQWLFFQASGQGYVCTLHGPIITSIQRITYCGIRRPYFGQAFWFLNYHQEKIPSAVERYQKETIRVLGVLESVLSKRDWLVGGKCTIADLSFITYVADTVLRGRSLADCVGVLGVVLGGTRLRSSSSSRTTLASMSRRTSLL